MIPTVYNSAQCPCLLTQELKAQTNHCNIITALQFLVFIHINKAEFFVCTDKELCIHINASVFLQFIQQQNII